MSIPPAQRGSLVFGLLVVWTFLLHGLLVVLWPERSRLGLMTLSTTDILKPNHPVILSFLIVMFVGLLLKLRRLHPGVLSCFFLTTPGPRRRLARVFGFYALLAIGGGIVDVGIAYHFAATIGIYCLMMTLVTGLLFSGERRPFLGLTLEPTAEDAAARRRLWMVDAACLLLLALLYTSFVYYYEIRDWEYNLSPPQAVLLQLALTAGCIGLGWGLLHGRLKSVVSSYVRRLEDEASIYSGPSAGALREVSAHGAVVAGVCVAMRLANEGIDWLRAHDAWITTEESSVVLGVDWYFVSVREWTEMGELFVFMGFLVAHSLQTVSSRSRTHTTAVV